MPAAVRPPTDEERCTAIVRSTGKRCSQWAIKGGPVCYHHGGQLPVVKAAAQRRLAERELDLIDAALDDPDRPLATPAAMLVHAASSAHAVVALMEKNDIPRTGTAKQLREYGEWLDRLSRSAKQVVSSKADELVIAQQARVAEGQARQMWKVLNDVLEALNLTPEQVAQVPGAAAGALHALGLLPNQLQQAEADRSGEGRLAMIRREIEQ